MTEKQRLNRFIAACGLCSRRKADLLVRTGRVTVNLEVCPDPSRIIDPGRDSVRVDGEIISVQEKLYIAMHKPRGCVCSVSDQFSRTVLELLPPWYRARGLFPVGRLDKDSEGLLLLTNDGALAHRILHPGQHVPKTYQVLLDSQLSADSIESFSRGTEIEGRLVRPEGVTLLKKNPEGRWITITLSEGIKREIRIMASTRGFRVKKLVRTGIGRLELKRLGPGNFIALDGEALLRMILHGGSV